MATGEVLEDRSRLRTSVVATAHNGERFLRRQLSSIAAQTRAPDEVVFGDDASTDASLAIAREVLEAMGVALTVLPAVAHLGLAANLTRCLERTSGDVVHIADHDDIWHPDRLAHMEQVLADNPAAELAFCDGRTIDDDDRPTGESLWRQVGFGPAEQKQWARSPLRVLVRRTVVTGPTMAVRRSLLENALPLPDGCWPDEWLALGAALRGRPIVPVPVALVDYRTHAGNTAGLPASGLRQRLYQAGWPQQSRAAIWQLACARFGPNDGARFLAEAASFAGRRPDRAVPLLRRLSQVGSLAVRGQYARYGQGWPMAVHDAVSPLLYGRASA